MSNNTENDINNLILYFTANWCEPCRNTRPIVEQLNMDQTSVKFFIIDVENAKQMAKDFDITSIPTFILIKDGTQSSRITGQQSLEKLQEMIYSYE
jgi:thioredoxin 1